MVEVRRPPHLASVCSPFGILSAELGGQDLLGDKTLCTIKKNGPGVMPLGELGAPLLLLGGLQKEQVGGLLENVLECQETARGSHAPGSKLYPLGQGWLLF